MAVSSNGTLLANIINPQVLADMISAELPNKIALAGIADVGRTLQGKAGNTITLPKWVYIGDASDIAEGADMSIAQMSTTDADVTVKKAGQGVELTDEAILSGYGDPVGEARKQLTMSVANKVDNDLFAALGTANALTHTTAAGGLKVVDVLTARAKFGENLNEDSVVIINSANFTSIAGDVLALENSDNVLINGVVGKVGGAQLVVSNKVTAGTAYLLRKGALGLELKRDVMVETDRDIIAGTNVITVNEHYATYLKDESKVVKITITA